MNKSMVVELGFKVRQLREKKGIKQEELAIQIGISQATLSKIENGQLEVTLRRVETICQALEVNPVEFLASLIKSQITPVINKSAQVVSNSPNDDKAQYFYQFNKEEMFTILAELLERMNYLKNSK